MTKMLLILFVVVFLPGIVFVDGARNCVIDIRKDFPKEQRKAPLLVNPHAQADEDPLIYAEDYFVRLQDGKAINFVCGDMFWQSKCVDGKFEKDNTTAFFSAFKCEKDMTFIAKFNGKTCPENRTFSEFQLGFDTTYRFIPTINGCFDIIDKITQYVVFKMPKSVNEKQVCSRSVSWMIKEIYSSAPDYQEVNAEIKKELGPGYNVDRGHLGAMTDLPYCQQQLSTFHYINAVPQCANCNRGSWKKVEKFIRDYVGTGSAKYQEITAGMYGIIPLKKKTDIPVPEYIWKVVPSTGYAFVGKNVLNSTEFCTNECDKIIPKEIKLNDYIFCCNITEFKKTVTILP